MNTHLNDNKRSIVYWLKIAFQSPSTKECAGSAHKISKMSQPKHRRQASQSGSRERKHLHFLLHPDFLDAAKGPLFQQQMLSHVHQSLVSVAAQRMGTQLPSYPDTVSITLFLSCIQKINTCYLETSWPRTIWYSISWQAAGYHHSIKHRA